MPVISDSLKNVDAFLGDLFKRLTKKRDQYLSGEIVFEVNVNAFLVLNAVFLTSSLPNSMRLRPELVRQMDSIKEILMKLPKLTIFSAPGHLEKARELNLGLYRSVVMLQLVRVKPNLIVDLADVSTRLKTLKVVESIGSLDEVYDVTLPPSPAAAAAAASPSSSGTSPASSSSSVTMTSLVTSNGSDESVKRLIKNKCWNELRAVSFCGNFIAEMSPLLGSMRHVETLDLSENLIRRVQYLQGCISLTTLNLTNNSIADVTGIAQELGNVKTLILRHNRIRSTQGLEALFGLEELDLAENAIDDIMQISRLAALPILGSLWLEGNIIANRLAYRREVLTLFVKQFSADTTYSLCLDGLYPSEEEYKAIVASAPLLYNPVISFSSRSIVRENSSGTIGSAVSFSSSTLHKRVKSKRKSKLVDLDSNNVSSSYSSSSASFSSYSSSSISSSIPSSTSTSHKHAQSGSRRISKKKNTLPSQKKSSSSAAVVDKEKEPGSGGPSSAPKVHRKLQNAVSSSSSSAYDSNNEDGGNTTGGSMNNYDAYADEEGAGSDLSKTPTGFNDSALVAGGEYDDIDDMEYGGGGGSGSYTAGIAGSSQVQRGRGGGNRRPRLAGSSGVEDDDEEDDDEEYYGRDTVVAASVPTFAGGESSTISKSKEWLNKIEQIREQTGKRWLIAVDELVKQQQQQQHQGDDDSNNNSRNNSLTSSKDNGRTATRSKSPHNRSKSPHKRSEAPLKPIIGSFPDDEIKKELVYNFVSSNDDGGDDDNDDAETNPFATTTTNKTRQNLTKPEKKIIDPLDATNPFIVTPLQEPSSYHPHVEPMNLFTEKKSALTSSIAAATAAAASASASASSESSSDATNPFLDASISTLAKPKVGSLDQTNPFLDQQEQQEQQHPLIPASYEPRHVQARIPGGRNSSKRASAEIMFDPLSQRQQQQQISCSPSITEPLYGIGIYANSSNQQQQQQHQVAQSYYQQPSHSPSYATNIQQQQQQQYYQQPSQSPAQSTPTPAHKDDAFNDTLNTMLRDDSGLETWLQLKVFQEDVDEFFFLALECTAHKTGCPALLIIGTKRLYIVAAQSRERVKDPKEWMTRRVAILSLSLADLRSVAVGPRYQYLRLEPSESSAVASSNFVLFVPPVHEKAHIFVDALAQKVKSSYEMMDDYDPETTQIDFEVTYLARQTRANFTSNIIKSKKNRAPPPASICVYAFVLYGEKREPMTLIATPLRLFVCKDEFYRWPLPKVQFTKEREVIIAEISSVSLDRCSLTINEDRESWVIFFPNKQELALTVSIIEQLYYAILRIPLAKED